MKLYENYGICTFIDNTKELKRRLIEKFDEKIGFFPSGKQLIVFSKEVNPYQYSVENLAGFGLSDNDIIRSFARMVRRKLQTCNQLRESWPRSIDDIENFVQRGPLLELYNAIYATINPSFKVHSTEYAVTPSHQSAIKIWSIASDWEYLVTKKKTSKQVLTGSNFHLDFS